MQECIQNCTDCFQVCSQVIGHCLSKGGKHADPKHIKLLEDCSKVCNLSADFMVRNSELHMSTCRACAEVCQACAKSCQEMASDDQVMQICADICRSCADSCLKMVKMQ
jgi:hypothetical protein